MARHTKRLRPVHPGEILREEFMEPLGLSANRLALELHVPAPRINDIVREERGITPDTALRLGRYFHTTAQFWMNLQSAHDLSVAQEKGLGQVKREVNPRRAVAGGTRARVLRRG